MNTPSPIFAKIYEFMRWMVPATNKFPRHQRFVLAKVIQECTFELHEELVLATKMKQNIQHLHKADAALTKVRTYIRLAQELDYFTKGQYEHASRMLVEIGKLLGGWQRSIK
jgi:four helix bundle protein